MSIGVRLVDAVPFGVDTPADLEKARRLLEAGRMSTAAAATDPQQRIAFQGVPGAYSHLACRQAYPELDALPCHSFEDAFAAVRDGAGPLRHDRGRQLDRRPRRRRPPPAAAGAACTSSASSSCA